MIIRKNDCSISKKMSMDDLLAVGLGAGLFAGDFYAIKLIAWAMLNMAAVEGKKVTDHETNKKAKRASKWGMLFFLKFIGLFSILYFFIIHLKLNPISLFIGMFLSMTFLVIKHVIEYNKKIEAIIK